MLLNHSELEGVFIVSANRSTKNMKAVLVETKRSLEGRSGLSTSTSAEKYLIAWSMLRYGFKPGAIRAYHPGDL